MSSHDMRLRWKSRLACPWRQWEPWRKRDQKWRKRRQAIADLRHGRNRPASIWWPLFALLVLLTGRRA